MMKKILLLIIALLLQNMPNALAIDITATGSWTRSITASDLVSGAGSNLTNSYESTPGMTTLTISNTTGNTDNWRVDVRRTDATWNQNVSLLVRRTSDGSGGGSISGGNSYAAVGPTDSPFFSGAGNRAGITLQFKLSGMSIGVPPATYGTTVIVTVVDTN